MGIRFEAWASVVWVSAAVAVSCAFLPTGTATLERRRTSEEPLPEASDVRDVAGILRAHGVACDNVRVASSAPFPSAPAGLIEQGSCQGDGRDLRIAVYGPGDPMPDPHGPKCSPGLEDFDGEKVVSEARGANFTIRADPPGGELKSQGAPEIWISISDATTAVAQAAGLDMMEFTFRCS